MYWLYWCAPSWHLHVALTTANGCLSVNVNVNVVCQWCHAREMEPDGEECQWWQLEQTGACVHEVCSENMVVFIALLKWNLSKLYAQAHTGVTALSLKSDEKHHMQGRPSSPPSRPGSNTAHSWRMVEVRVYCLHWCLLSHSSAVPFSINSF